MRIMDLKNKKLSLKNDGKLSLFFVGVGSAFSKLNNQTNLLIVKGDDHILVDCGTKCAQAVVESGFSITEIQTFLITHSHADHIGGLEEAALMGRYLTRSKPSMIICEEYQKMLWDMSLRGGCSFSERKGEGYLDFEDFFTPIRPKMLPNMPRDMMETNIGSINIKQFRTKHLPEKCETWKTPFWSCGIMIDDRILFTGDTQFDSELILSFEELFHPEFIFHDCQLYPGGVHAYIEELNTLPADIKRKMLLTHFGDNWVMFEEKAAQYGFMGFAKQQVFYIFD